MGKADKIKKGLRMICAYPMRITNGISFRATVVDSDIHKSSKIMYGSNVRYSTVGKNTYLGRNVFAAHTDIGAFCSIANGVVIGGGTHNLKAVSTSPLFEANHNIFGKNFADISFDPHRKTKIGNDVWIGTNAIILQGVTISDGAVVGAGAVVTKDVEPYTIVAGCPARPINRRFSDDVSDKLLQSCWWEIDDDNIRKLGKYFDDPEEFLKQLKKLKEQN